VTERNAEGTLTFQRETFEYSGRGRRDPFVSLIKSGELRPLFSDLKLVTVLYDPTGRNSVAIMHDVSTKDQYRVKVGQTLGRMRVSQIQPKQVVFAIEEFGYGRQAVLALTDSTKARKQ
jgi:Tfp pilus assembly protein PilP